MSPSDADFRTLVDRALRNDPTLDVGVLEADIDRWWSVLSEMKKSVETQLAAKRDEARIERARRQGRPPQQADIHAEQEYAKWRAGAVRFKNVVEAAMIKVALRRNQRRPDAVLTLLVEDRNLWHARSMVLEDAIRYHREKAITSGLEPEDNELLWSMLDD